MTSPFEDYRDRDVVDLIEQNPLAWLVSHQGGFRATPLPILVECDGDGRPVSLIGHMARRNPQVAAMTDNPDVLFLFTGPHGYISPAFLSDRDWGPTWNYAVAPIGAQLRFDEALTDEAVAALVEKMEQGRDRPWTAAELGPRYHQLRRHIIGFRATNLLVMARFKLGQDERPEVLDEILAGLGDVPLAGWMRRFNGRSD